MAEALQAYAITAPGFYGLNTQDSSLDLASGFSLVATNCVIDQYGRVGARKGWSPLNSISTDLSTNDVQMIAELVANDGTSYIICAGNNKLFKYSSGSLTTLTYGGGGVAPTISANHWQAAAINGYLVLYQSNYDPLIFDPATSTTSYKRISEHSTYTGTVQKGNCVISAYGRTWSANVSNNKVTVQWSDLQAPCVFSGGTSGTLNTSQVWPKGTDSIVALGAHNGFLYIFGKNNILIYQGANDPASMSLYDVVTGIGCIARDSVANTGTDIIFLSQTGVRSLLRTIQEKSAPFRELSKNVRNDLMSYVAGESDTSIKAVHSPVDAFYLLSLNTGRIVYCFDTKGQLQDGAARATTWDNILPKAYCAKQDGTLLLGQAGYIGQYTGNLDNTSEYRFVYYTNHTDFGDPIVTSIPKRLLVTVIGGNDQVVTLKWAYDFTGNFYSQNAIIPSNNIAYYGESEYNYGADYSNGQVMSTLRVYPTSSGKVLQFGFEAQITGASLSIQKIEIHAKQGKIS